MLATSVRSTSEGFCRPGMLCKMARLTDGELDRIRRGFDQGLDDLAACVRCRAGNRAH